MADQNKAILDGLLHAMKAEGDGHNFYRMAAMNTNDSKGRDVFEMLAREEAEHYNYLKSQYEHVLETGGVDANLSLPIRTELDGMSPIFSERVKDRIDEAHMEMSALSIGVQLELNAMKFYSEEAEKHDDPTIRKFYTELAAWEKGHYDALLRQQEHLRDDYWSAGGFSPF